MLAGDLVLGPVTGTYYSLFQNEISNIPTVSHSLCNQTLRITRHNLSVTRYKSVIKTALTGRQPVWPHLKHSKDSFKYHFHLLIPRIHRYGGCIVTGR